MTLERVRAAMAKEGPSEPWPWPAAEPAGDSSQAAVLAALFEEDGEARVILTRRAAHLRSHTGEVSFPGGRLDEDEDALSAALREATEEIGLDPSTVQIVGELSPLATVGSRAAITPFVGVLLTRPELKPNPDEVELAFDVSLAELMAGGVFREERWQWNGQPDRPMYFFDLPDDTIWGATARMLYELLELVALT
ncbi:MAG: CoA pyrophosphatase [Actinobacteria bacterium]|nr:CoA pyrophosphatase [Actinomycetota bacterium]